MRSGLTGVAGALGGRSNLLKPFAAGFVLAVIIIAVIFALPLKTIRVESTESYFVTELKQEPYTVSEPYTAEEVEEHSEVLVDGYYISSPAGITVPFQIDRADTLLAVSFDNSFVGTFAIVEQPNRVVWQTRSSGAETELELEPGDYLARFRESMMWGQDCYIYVAVQWNETKQVTLHRDVTEYRDIQTQVEKERTVVHEEKISIWKHIFD